MLEIMLTAGILLVIMPGERDSLRKEKRLDSLKIEIHTLMQFWLPEFRSLKKVHDF